MRQGKNLQAGMDNVTLRVPRPGRLPEKNRPVNGHVIYLMISRQCTLRFTQPYKGFVSTIPFPLILMAVLMAPRVLICGKVSNLRVLFTDLFILGKILWAYQEITELLGGIADVVVRHHLAVTRFFPNLFSASTLIPPTDQAFLPNLVQVEDMKTL